MAQPVRHVSPDALSTLGSRLIGLLNRGVEPSQDPGLQRIVRLTNMTALTSLAFAAVTGLMMIPAIGWWVLPDLVGFVVCAWGVILNWRGHHLAARWTIILAITVTLITYSLAFGGTPSFHVALLIPLCFSVMAFLPEERRYSVLSVAGILLASAVAMTYWHLAGPLAAPMSPMWSTILDVFGVSMTFLIIAAAGYTFVIKTERIEQDLAKSNQDLHRQSGLLAAVNNEMQRQLSELEQANRTIMEKTRLAELANRHKSEFLANMSHELRTPLNSMILLSKLMANNHAGYLQPDEVEHASIIHDSGKSLLNLINDILEMSKIEAEKIDLQLAPMASRAFAEELEFLHRGVAERQQLAFGVIIADDLPGYIQADKLRLQQVITNLLSNAMKFTHAGGQVRLAFGVDATGPCPQLTISVTDTGIGIPADKMDRIFVAFEQADGSSSRRHGGTGLGLALSQRLAELMGGTIRAESKEGVGSTFTLSLPLLHAQENASEPAPMGPAAAIMDPESGGMSKHSSGMFERPSLKGRTLVLVDDDMRNLYSIARVLQQFGARVVKATSGADCLLAKLDTLESVDAVLTDIMMPGMEGHELIRRIRRDPAYAELPIIALTAKTMSDDRQRVMDCGATGFLSKPIDIESLLALLGDHVPAAA